MADVLAFWDDRKLMEYSRFIQERKKSAVLIKYCKTSIMGAVFY